MRDADPERGAAGNAQIRGNEALGFLVEGPLVGQGEAAPAIFLRHGDAGETAVEQLALPGPLHRDALDCLVVGAPGPGSRSGRAPGFEVGLQPGPGFPAESVDVDELIAHVVFLRVRSAGRPVRGARPDRHKGPHRW